MATDPRSNAVTRRLGQVQQLYIEAATSTPEMSLCPWIVEPDEVQMIEAFVLTEDTPGAVTRDLFLTFRGGDAGAMNYPQQLVEGLHLQLSAAEEEAAWRLTLEALEVAEGLSPEILRGSPLPYAGRELLRLVENLNRHSAAGVLRARLDRLIGNDWEELLHKAETPVPA